MESFRNELKAKLESEDIEFNGDKYKFHIANFQTCEEEQLYAKPTLPGDYIAEEEIESFFEKLVFAVNQPNEVVLGRIIEAEMGESKDINLIDNSFIASEFQKEMLDWMKDKKGRFLSHKDGQVFFNEAKQKLDKLVSISPTLEYSAKIEEFGISFNDNVSEELHNFFNSEKQIFNLVSPQTTMLSSIKVYQTLKDTPEYIKHDSYIFIRLSSLLRIQNRIVQAFSSKTSDHLLVIECKSREGNIQELFNQLSGIIQSNNNKKVILITQESSALADKFKDDFSKNDKYEERRDEKNNFVDLTSESQEKLLEKRKVIFQGKEVTLGQLIDENSKEVVDSEILLKLINNDEVKLGNELLDLGEIKYYYIDRMFNRYVKIKENFKQEISKFFIIYNSQDVTQPNHQQDQDIVLISDVAANR